MFITLNKARCSQAFTITELVFVVVIIVIFIVLLTPFINKIRTQAKIIACEENLRNIGLGLKLYANEHQGKFPPNMEALLENGYVEDERVFDCPASSHVGNAKEPDYHYVTEYTIESPSEDEIVFDKTENHKGGKHVLYISGDIKWIAAQ